MYNKPRLMPMHKLQKKHKQSAVSNVKSDENTKSSSPYYQNHATFVHETYIQMASWLVGWLELNGTFNTI